jgi:hypothetical protein
MGQNYLLIEGVNLDATIYDTNQLSIIRGSSFLYKEAVEKIYKKFADQLTALSTGASVGLFQIKDPAEIEALKKDVINFINKHHNYRHLSLLVETCQADNILQAKQTLQTQLRWRQLRALSQVPDKQDTKQNHLFDSRPSGLEGVRIAHTGNSPIIQDAKHISLSEKVRWNKGRSTKQNYYTSLTKQIDNSLSDTLRYSFATTIQDLCNCKVYSQLDGKMAVIYIDGNGFGERQFKYLKAAIDKGEDGTDAQITFDHKIQQERIEFLTNTLKDFVGHRYDDGMDDTTIRLETLLWGGDEMLFVLPAWLGFEFLQRFYQSAETWKLSDGAPLTHAAGIVFCKAKSPIRIIQKLAKALAERVKEECSREQSAWDYMVLESMDYPTDTDLDEYFTTRYQQLATYRPTGHFINKPHWDKVSEHLDDLLSLTTAHQLHRLSEVLLKQGCAGTYAWQDLSLLADDKKTTELSAQELQEQRLLAVMPSSKARKTFIELSQQVAQELFNLNILHSAPQRAWFWLHLLELWNYLLPKKSSLNTQEMAI